MRRAAFGAGLAASALAAGAAPAFGALRAAGPQVTLDALVGTLAPPHAHTWVQYVLGSGVPYLKKIGYGVERTSQGPARVHRDADRERRDDLQSEHDP